MGFGIAEIKTWALARLTAAQRAAGAVGPAGVTAAGGLVDASGASVSAVTPLIATPGIVLNDQAAAAANSAALNAALQTYGYAAVLGAGVGTDVCWISRTIEPRAHSVLSVRGATLKLAPSRSCSLVRNRNCQVSLNSTNTVSIASLTATITVQGHNFTAGSQVYIKGGFGNTTINGPKTIGTVVGDQITVPVGNNNPLTNTDQEPLHIGRYNPLAGANFVRSGNVVTVTETGHRRLAGCHVYVDGLTGAASFNGPQKILSVVPGVSWTYASTGTAETAGGTAQLAGDNNIVLDIESCDYNGADGNAFSEMGAINVVLGNASYCRVRLEELRGGLSRSLHFFNCSHVDAPRIHSTGGKGTVQIESHCDFFHVGHVSMYGGTDDIIAWGVTANGGTFGATESASGQANMGALVIDLISGGSSTGSFKLFGTTGYDLGRVKIGSNVATGVMALGDGNPGASGASVTSLVIDNCDNIPVLNQSQLQISGGLTFERLHIWRLRDNATSAATTGHVINMGATCSRFTIGSLELPLARTSATYGILLASPVGYLGIGEMIGTIGADSRVILCNGATGIIDDLTIDSIRIVGTNAAHGPVLYEQGGGFIRRLRVNGGHLQLCKGLHASNSAGQTHEIQISNLTAQSVDWFLSSDVAGTFNVSLQNVALASTTTNLLHYYVGSTVVRFVGNNVRAPSGQWALFTSTTSIGIDCKECRIDLGANGGAPPSQLAPLAGDMLTNSNATGGGVYGRTAAGAWLKLI